MFSSNLLFKAYWRQLGRSDKYAITRFSKAGDFLKIFPSLFQQMPKAFSTDGEDDKLPSLYKYFVNSKMPLIKSNNPSMKEITAKAAIRLEWVSLSDEEKKKIKDQYNSAYNIQEEPIYDPPPRTAYQAFCKEYRPLLKEANEKVTVDVMSKRLSQKYKSLSEKEKEKYLVYQPTVEPVELAPPRNTYQAFCRVYRPLLLAEASDTSIGAISKLLSAKYKSLTKEELEKYKVHKEEEEEEEVKELDPPKTAFQAFCREQRPLLKPTLPENSGVRNLMSLLSAQWKSLSESEKKKYEIPKPPQPPKRVSAYNAFLTDRWKTIKETNPSATLMEASKEASVAWKRMSTHDKEIYKTQHEERMLAAGVPPKGEEN